MVDWPLAVREGLDPARIHPVIMPILLVWLGLPIHLFKFGPTLTAGFIATVLIAIPAFWLARKVAIRMSAGHGSGIKTVAFILAILCGGFVQGVATLPYMQNQTQPFLFLVATPLLALLISGPLAIAETARDQDLELESELVATTADLRWTVTRAREQYRQHESALAHALHGRLQASLAAAFLRLDRAVAQDADGNSLLASLQDELRDAISELDVIHSEPETIEKLISLTQSNWLDTVHIDFSIEEQAKELLSADSLCARSVNDLIPELVFNSVRHGKAGSIEVRIELADPRTLSLSVIDDGAADITSIHCGLGTALLDQASITWSRTRSDTHTSTTCLLPILRSSFVLLSP
jgi:signal transduction histidine kinase